MAQHRLDRPDVDVPDESEPADSPSSGLKRRWALPLPAAVLAVCLFLGCGAAVVMLRDPGPGAPADGGATDSINMNTADSTELQTLPRVGPVLAERIITRRTEYGGLGRPEDLDAVPGIGEAMMAALLPPVTV